MWHGHHPLYGSYPPGLPTAGKPPPPLNMVSPAAKIQRTTATVPPMNQVSPSSSITSINSNNALSATRASSFAAALRKLAKQAGDPPDVVGGGILRDSVREPSPVTAVTSPRTPTPKRVPPGPGGVYNNGSSVINSPPVVTIAPTPSHSSTSESRKSVDRAGAPSSSTNAAMIEPLGIKTERDKMTAASLGSGAGSGGGAPSSHDRRDEERPRSKDSSLARPLSTHHMMNNSSAAAPAPGGSSSGSRDEAPRGFQPYRPGEDLRHSLPPHFPLDAATAAAAAYSAAYPAAFMSPHLAHPAFRFDDPMLLERYRMMQSPLMSGLPGYHPSMLHPQGISPLLHPGSRYPPELLAQHYPLMSPKLPDHRSPGASVDRKSEEEERREREGRERHEREREERERERERREREEQERRERERLEKERQERERERIERERQERERQERERIERERMERERERQLSYERLRAHDVERKSPARNDDSGRYGSITAGTPRDAIYGDKYRNAMYPPPRDSVLSKPYSSLSAGVEERLTQSHLADKERGRQFMHEQVRHLYTEQYIRQQEALMREREQEKREQERREKGTPPSKDDSRHIRTSEPSGFHRPFADRPLTNGFEHNHFSDYERRIMTENILAQDRQILQDQQRPRSRPNSGHNGTNHSDSRTYDQVNDRSYIEKQHEGMQARLIESEKSREHHAHLYNPRLNQYDYDRPHAETQPVAASAFSQQSTYSNHSKDSNHISRNDSRELRVPDPSNYFRFDAPVLSKLDLEEKKMKEARKNGMYNSDDSASESEDELAKEDRRKEKLLVITSGPACRLDKSPKKLKYMQQFGLTTKEERKELDYERFSKRRKLYKESSVSPVQMGDDRELETSFRTEDSLSPHAKGLHSNIYHPDQINREPDYSYKCNFFLKMGLQRVPPERRREMDIIRHVCLEDKRRRLGLKYHSKSNQHLPNSLLRNHVLTDQLNGLKRKYSEMESSSMRPHRPEPQRITLGQLHERHLQTEHSSRPSLSQSSHHQPSSADSRAVIYPESHDAKLRSREFAQEFHNEVLQATVKKEISKNQIGGRSGSQGELRYNMDTLDPNVYRGSSVGNSSNVIHSNKMSLVHDDSHSQTNTTSQMPYKWPGIEAILESYQKHCEEQKMEQGILVEQCQRLQRTNADLHKTAESLSRRMADLMQGKSKGEDDRQRTQTAIDNLKKSLKVLR